MSQGYLILKLRTAFNQLAVNKCKIKIDTSNGTTVYEKTTGLEVGGMTQPIPLEAPDLNESLNPHFSGTPYSVYTAAVSADGYYRSIINNIQIFGDNTAILPVDMIPLPVTVPSPDAAPPLNYLIPPHHLTYTQNETIKKIPDSKANLNPVQERKADKIMSDDIVKPAIQILEGVYIPEKIVVHLGAPSSNAENYTVSFTDYIKNVASSEIYPTWPKSSLQANIIAQISLALNRIYTEWYRSRGYNFDITSSTAYDQYFVKGRNVFDSISSEVDEVFNVYIKRPFSTAPYYAEYCSGTTVTCPGMSQWGTVSLANEGYSFDEIIKYYYGNVELVASRNLRAITSSYPGTPLSIGSKGDNVRLIQSQLNRIAINYPIIPFTPTDGVFGEMTDKAVRAFQKLFLTSVDGIVGKSTWYKISYVYVSVKRLAELSSEGQRPAYTEYAYPGFVLKLNSKGIEVQQIQFYLSKINLVNPNVLTTVVDGFFGRGTENSVKSFQRNYNLTEDGIVGKITWLSIVNVYLGAVKNLDVPNSPFTLRPYPGTPLRVGSTGDDVRHVQAMINLINTIFVPIKSLKEDGGFGALTKASVMEFQKIYNYIADGIVSRQTWNRLTSTYNEVASKCIFSDRTCVGTKSYAGTPLKRGSAGNEVRYIQARLKLIYQYLPIIGEVEIDSIFGAQTEKTVMSIQRLFGLVPDGIVGQTTFNLINYIYCASDYGCLSKPSASGISVISEADLPVSTDPDEEPETSAEWEDIQESNQ